MKNIIENKKEKKIISTSRNKIRRIEKEMRKHPKLMNSTTMLDRLKFWKGKLGL